MASVAACPSERAARKRTPRRVEIEVRVIFFPIECDLLRHARHRRRAKTGSVRAVSMRPAFRPAAGGGARAAGYRDQGARSCFRTQDRPSIRAHKPSRSQTGAPAPEGEASSSRSRGRVRTARASARRRTVGLGATAQAPVDLNQRDPRAQTTNAGSDPGRQKELRSRGAMSPTAPPGGPPRNTRCSSRTRTTLATAPAIDAPPIPRGAIPAIHGRKPEGVKIRPSSINR